MNIRLAQIESTLRRAIASVLSRGLGDPRISGLVSITRVSISPDLHDAFVFISVMPKKHTKTALAGLKSAAGRIGGLVDKQVAMSHFPRLVFRLDASYQKETEILTAINRGMKREKSGKRAAASEIEIGHQDTKSTKKTGMDVIS